MVTEDPVVTNPEHYRTLFENDYVRVLEYTDEPGESTTAHVHPNSVMITLTDFQRRLSVGGHEREVSLAANQAMWVPAQRHAGANIGQTPTHTIFVELKGPSAGDVSDATLGPVAA
ncbi:hypothetical protein DC31_00525 [Microbacterium sp. CH12i]|uniref:cupin domain-containing protein n=1 Tax=Microbacterium sp. CH12i TaxID=1479651 RepID=UPI0004618FC5|nr:cupin domain-containing protein [Microbacterium sp. CH12i]KDA06982.1 hypothetical protein DC31_00525 [Microbacterium sp. CH12i]